MQILSTSELQIKFFLKNEYDFFAEKNSFKKQFFDSF